jgi:peptide subunit release factor 1 (eRF1)
MRDVTQDAVQMLLDHPKGEGMIVSCYANTSVTAGFASSWSQHLKNEASAIERRLGDDHQARARFTRDIQIIQHALEDPAVPRARGMALFSADERGFFHAFTLSVPVKDCLVLDEDPYLVPLLQAMHRQRRYLLVLTDSHRGRLYEAAWGRTHLLGQIEEEIPRRQRSAGERWGKQQATIARHREDHLLHYRKALAEAIEKAWPEAPFRGLILLGDLETVEALRTALPSVLGKRVVHTGAYSFALQEPTLDAQVQDVLDDALRAHDAGLVADLERRLHEHHLVAAGPQEVVDALHRGQVEYPGYLVLEPDRGDMASRCPRCESVFTTMPETCSFCQSRCERVNLWQEILLFAARHDITAHTVEENPTLSRHGGVAAVLSRQEPWEPAVPEAATGPGSQVLR